MRRVVSCPRVFLVLWPAFRSSAPRTSRRRALQRTFPGSPEGPCTSPSFPPQSTRLRHAPPSACIAHQNNQTPLRPKQSNGGKIYHDRTCRRRWWLWLWTFARVGERSKSGVGASTRSSGSPATPAPLIAAAVAAAPTLAALPCRVVTRGEGTRIEDPSHQDRAGRGHMSLNPISSQSLPVLFIYLFVVTNAGCIVHPTLNVDHPDHPRTCLLYTSPSPRDS